MTLSGRSAEQQVSCSRRVVKTTAPRRKPLITNSNANTVTNEVDHDETKYAGHAFITRSRYLLPPDHTASPGKYGLLGVQGFGVGEVEHDVEGRGR